jgi:hypothetical protein
MTRIVLALALAIVVMAGAGVAAQVADSCSTCHTELDDARLSGPVTAFRDDIHRAKGFGCAACHGGDPTVADVDAMDPAKGYIGVPTRQQVPQVCARCHADAGFMRHYAPGLRVDQLAEYETSVHGQRLREQGDDKVATCASCHTAHSIRPASDARSTVHASRVVETCSRCHADAAYMQSYGIATDQLGKYQQSVHWRTLTEKGDLSAPTCNDCHGNHGATPPGVTWVGNVCGQCHAVQAELFTRSRHAGAFADMGTPGCATCHSNHDVVAAGDAMLGLGEGAVCATCHAADDAGGKAALAMRELIEGLQREHGRSHEILLRAERAGMEVSQAQFDLNTASEALVKARAAVHAATAEAVSGPVKEGRTVAARAYEQGERALEELGFRRKGLAVSLLIIIAVIGGLVLKIREMDRQ